MARESDRQDYPAMLATLQPSEAMTVLDNRMRQIGRLNTEIADWLQERRKVEEQYSAGLRKLAKRQAIQDPADLGILSAPWTSLVDGVATLANSHHTLAQKIEADVETPLRDFHSTNKEVTTMATIQGALLSISRDIDHAQKRADKLHDKGTRALNDKVANASSDLDNARAQWDSQAPYVFENLQAIDETRMTLLRDVLTQFQTHETDQIERDRLAVEHSLNTLVTVETVDEIKTFALRTLSTRPSTADRQRGRASLVGNSPTTLNFSSSVNTAHTASPSMDDRASQADTVPELPTSKVDKPRGFRRLGTVLSRRRQSKMPAGAEKIADMAGSPERRTGDRRSMMPGNSTFSSFTNRMAGRSRDALTLDPPQEDGNERPRSPLRTMSSTTDTFDQPNSSLETATPVNNKVSTPNTLESKALPKTPSQIAPRQELPATSTNAPQLDASMPSSTLVDSITMAEREAASEPNPNQLQVNIGDAPVVRDDGDASALFNVANTLKMQAPQANTRKMGTVRGRRENRASVYTSTGATSGLSDLGSNENSALGYNDPAKKLAPVTTDPRGLTSSISQPFLSQPQVLGEQILQSPLSGGASLPQPFSASSLRQNSIVEDAQSIRSGRSLGSTTSQAHKHPESDEPGLSASIIETVSAWFEDDKLTRSVVIGELALGYRPTTSASPSASKAVIKLENFLQLEKVAPNPSFVTPDSASGQYALDMRQLSRSQVAFKYQVRVPADGAGQYAPLLLSLAWKVDESTTLVIVTCSLNPAFRSGMQDTELKNVNVVLYLGEGGARAVSCQSKPAGVFNRERNCIAWSLGNLGLSSFSDGSMKLLARFATQGGTGRAGRVDAKWELLQSGSEIQTAADGLAVSVLSTGDGAANTENPFHDESTTPRLDKQWESVRTSRKLVAGTYQSSTSTTA